MSGIIVSVIMPLRNEEKYIKECIESLLLQNYPQKKMEWIFVDGESIDNTVSIIECFQKQYPDLIYLYHNPNFTVPYAMNIGIKNARGKYIVRLDAHADYAQDYIAKCVYYLDLIPEVDNVGGIAITKGKTPWGDTIAKMLSTKFGVGNSQFRINGTGGFVDTVPFGAFRKEVFERLGGYDVRLTRNQDNEMNYRIRKNGGKIYMASDIRFIYYCRESVKGICNMALQNGKWNVITMKLVPGSMGCRHFIPFIFVLSIIILLTSSIFYHNLAYLLLIEVFIYLICNFYFSTMIAGDSKQFLQLLYLYPLFHFSYGCGSLLGIWSSIKYINANRKEQVYDL